MNLVVPLSGDDEEYGFEYGDVSSRATAVPDAVPPGPHPFRDAAAFTATDAVRRRVAWRDSRAGQVTVG